MTVQLATWNVNSLTQRGDHVERWLKAHPVDVLVMQELKHTEDKFDAARWQALGYTSHLWGQKTYNGVAMLVKSERLEVLSWKTGLTGFKDDQARLVGAQVRPRNNPQAPALEVWGAYVPNGGTRGSQKYFYKLDWLAALVSHLQIRQKETPLVAIGGDFNIAPTDGDLYDPKLFQDEVLASSPERIFIHQLAHQGWVDAWRNRHPRTRQYSWWDYRQRGYENNHGLRIDHWFLSPQLAPSLHEATIDEEPRTWPQPSDHTPVIVTLNYGH